MKPTSDRGKVAATADPSVTPQQSPATPAVQTEPPARNYRRMDHHHSAVAVRHHYSGSGFRNSHRLHGRHAADRRSLAGGQAGLCAHRGGSASTSCLTRSPHDGDIIVFRYPVDISQTFVKRVVGVPGDRIKMIEQQVYRNGKKLTEPYVVHKNPYPRFVPRQLPQQRAEFHPARPRPRDAGEQRGQRRSGGAARFLFRHGRQSRQFARQPLLGLCPARETSSASRSSSTGPTMPAPRAWPVRQ